MKTDGVIKAISLYIEKQKVFNKNPEHCQSINIKEETRREAEDYFDAREGLRVLSEIAEREKMKNEGVLFDRLREYNKSLRAAEKNADKLLKNRISSDEAENLMEELFRAEEELKKFVE